MPSFFRKWSAELKSRMSCPFKDGTTPPPWLPHLLLHLLLLTKVQCQQAVTMVEEVEEETTTFLPEQREVPFGFIYSKEFRVRVCYKANVINVCNYQNNMTSWSPQSKRIFVTTGAGWCTFFIVLMIVVVNQCWQISGTITVCSQAIMGGVCGFWGGVFTMGFIYLLMVNRHKKSFWEVFMWTIDRSFFQVFIKRLVTPSEEDKSWMSRRKARS